RPPQRDANAEFQLVRADAEPFADEIPVRPVWKRLAVGHTAPLEPERLMLARGALGELAQLTEQPALADPGLAGDEQDAAGPRQHLVEGLTRRCQLSVPSDQRGVHAGEAAMPAHGAGGREGLARRDRFGLPLRIDVDRCAPAERVLDRAMGGLGDEDRVRWSRRLESRP